MTGSETKQELIGAKWYIRPEGEYTTVFTMTQLNDEHPIKSCEVNMELVDTCNGLTIQPKNYEDEKWLTLHRKLGEGSERYFSSVFPECWGRKQATMVWLRMMEGSTYADKESETYASFLHEFLVSWKEVLESKTWPPISEMSQAIGRGKFSMRKVSRAQQSLVYPRTLQATGKQVSSSQYRN